MAVIESHPLLTPVAPRRWMLPGGRTLTRPAALMGIINVTPDSFSDGGDCLAPALAAERALRLTTDGATWLDIGGESTRPGAAPVAADEELRRVLPAIAAVRAGLPAALLSIDTGKAVVARAALAAGAAMVNDVTAGADPDLFAVVAEHGALLVLMHMQGTPATMQAAPRYRDVADDVAAFLATRLRAAEAAGVPASSVVLDPGIGFGKTVEHNCALLRALPRLASEFDRPLLVGLSRKAFLARLAGRELPPVERDGAGHVIHAAIAAHCALLRVHDVAGAATACRLAAALRGDGGPDSAGGAP